MPLAFRSATPADYTMLEGMIIDAFEPITWMKKADERFGPLNGRDWRQRWQSRVTHIFATQMVLVGQTGGGIVAMASGTIDPAARLAFIDLLAVDQRFQGRGYGRAMLHGMLKHMKEQGAVHAHLECLTDNDAGNNLYREEGFEEVARFIRWFVKIPDY
ncbi:MAG: GNAT family N-acetyltransferase [Acidobacteriota bacterium]